MQWWTYPMRNQGPSGSLNRAGPERHPHMIGAIHPYAKAHRGDQRNASFRDPGAGRAASLQSVLQGVTSNDMDHEYTLDGHLHSVISQHPDGQFARNTALTSQGSALANFLHWSYPYTQTRTFKAGTRGEEEVSTQSTEASRKAAVNRLSRERRTRVGDDHIIGGTGAHGMASDFLTGRWGATEAALAGLGGYTALRLVGVM